mmetsp:Transcript_24041/g.94706  ORF Transcript_24041/g.94706 Transcript_24041/m.94706 type:complete len:202 (+) Transcript_24041:1748-2353(+)
MIRDMRVEVQAGHVLLREALVLLAQALDFLLQICEFRTHILLCRSNKHIWTFRSRLHLLAAELDDVIIDSLFGEIFNVAICIRQRRVNNSPYKRLRSLLGVTTDTPKVFTCRATHEAILQTRVFHVKLRSDLYDDLSGYFKVRQRNLEIDRRSGQALMELLVIPKLLVRCQQLHLRNHLLFLQTLHCRLGFHLCLFKQLFS